MTKKHHPHSREERLKLKLEHERKTKEERAGKIRRKLYKEELKLKEAEDVLQAYRAGTEHRSVDG